MKLIFLIVNIYEILDAAIVGGVVGIFIIIFSYINKFIKKYKNNGEDKLSPNNESKTENLKLNHEKKSNFNRFKFLIVTSFSLLTLFVIFNYFTFENVAVEPQAVNNSDYNEANESKMTAKEFYLEAEKLFIPNSDYTKLFNEGYSLENSYKMYVGKKENVDYRKKNIILNEASTVNASKQINYYTKAIKINPNFIDAIYSRAKIRYILYIKNKQNSIFDCLRDLNKVIELNPNHHNAIYLRSKLFLERDIKDKRLSIKSAQKDLNYLIKIKPEFDVYLQHQLAGCYMSAKDWNFALDKYTFLINNYSSVTDNSTWYHNRAYCKQFLGFNPCTDFRKACNAGIDNSCDEFYRVCE